MLRVSDVWERALHAPTLADACAPGDVMTVAVVARTDPQEQESVITLGLPPHRSDLNAFPVANREPQR